MDSFFSLISSVCREAVLGRNNSCLASSRDPVYANPFIEPGIAQGKESGPGVTCGRASLKQGLRSMAWLPAYLFLTCRQESSLLQVQEKGRNNQYNSGTSAW